MFKLKTAVAAVAFAVAGSANATILESLQGGEMVVSILNRDTGLSMLIDTNVVASSVVDGTTTAYSSNDTAGLTQAISDFIGTSTNVVFWAQSAYQVAGFFPTEFYSLSTVLSIDPTSSDLTGWDTQYNGFVSAANSLNTNFGSDLAGDGPDWEVGIDPTADDGYSNTSLGGVTFGTGLDTDVALLMSFLDQTNFLDIKSGQGIALGNWNLSSTGELTYTAVSAVPVPAAAWLFGSGLLGLVGVARRRRSA